LLRFLSHNHFFANHVTDIQPHALAQPSDDIKP